MRLLLDTHILLWLVTASPRLPLAAKQLVESEDHSFFASVASIWEVAIKHARRRGSAKDMPLSGRQALEDFEAAGFKLLAVSGIHAAAIDRLDRLHGDPFDRLLVAQAQVEDMKLVTHDRQLAAYGPAVLTV